MAAENDLEMARDSPPAKKASPPDRKRKEKKRRKDAEADASEKSEAGFPTLGVVAGGVGAIIVIGIIAYCTKGKCWGKTETGGPAPGPTGGAGIPPDVVPDWDSTNWAWATERKQIDPTPNNLCVRIGATNGGRCPTTWWYDGTEATVTSYRGSGDHVVYKPVNGGAVGEAFDFLGQRNKVVHYVGSKGNKGNSLHQDHAQLTKLLAAAAEAVSDGQFGEVHVILAMGYDFAPGRHNRGTCACFGAGSAGMHLEVQQSVMPDFATTGITMHIMNTYRCKPNSTPEASFKGDNDRFHISNDLDKWPQSEVLRTIKVHPNDRFTVRHLAEDFFNTLASTPDADGNPRWVGILCHTTC